MFRAIKFDGFPPFGSDIIEFPPIPEPVGDLAEVHLLTGINGTGKTRVLAVLSAFLGNPIPLVKRLQPKQNFTLFINNLLPSENPANSWSRMQVASSANPVWVHRSEPMKEIVNAPAFAYSGNAYVSDAKIVAMGAIQQPGRDVCLSFDRKEDSSKDLLQAITNLKLQAAMDSMDESFEKVPPRRAMNMMTALEKAVSDITGTPFRFNVVSYPEPTIAVIWGSKRLSFGALPDGLRSIIGSLAHALVLMDVWLQGKADPAAAKAIFLLDEIESHLHPAWQRKILPAFQKLFPKAQFFVTTHSPFVIASLNNGWIHSFKTGNDGTVKVEKPIRASSGDSYLTVVEDIMGIKEWFDTETESLLTDFRHARDSAYQGDAKAYEQVRNLAMNIGKRSMELEFMMGRELIQLERQLAKSSKDQ